MDNSNKMIFIGSSVHRWNDNRIYYKEAVSLAKKYHVELHAPAEFEQKHLNGVDIYGLPNWEKESDRKAIRNELWQRLKKSKMTIFHFPFQTSPRVSFGMELESNSFQLDSNWKILE